VPDGWSVKGVAGAVGGAGLAKRKEGNKIEKSNKTKQSRM